MQQKSVMVAPLSRAQIGDFALTLRRGMGFEDSGRVDMLKVVEWILPLIFSDYRFEIVDDHELGDAEATTSMSERVIRMKESCYRRAQRGHPRFPFTLAHELGHLFLHCLKGNQQLARGKVAAYLDPEWQADEFASAFLAPADEVRKCRSIAEIAARFGISSAAARVRASKLGLQIS